MKFPSSAFIINDEHECASAKNIKTYMESRLGYLNGEFYKNR